jgi:hypothetical protein
LIIKYKYHAKERKNTGGNQTAFEYRRGIGKADGKTVFYY